MRYSLLSQFRGAFQGAILGTILGTHCAKRLASPNSFLWTEVDHWGFQPLDVETTSAWGKAAICLTTDLIQGKPWTVEPLPDQDTLAGLAIATLPLSLYYHEDLNQQQHAIQVATSSYTHADADAEPALASILSTIGFTLSLALQHQCVPSLLISQLLSGLALEANYPFLAKQLLQVQQLTTDKVGLTIALADLTYPAPSSIEVASVVIALAFYTFLSTPHDFRLSLLRAAQMKYQPDLLCALVGALSGAYNGVSGLPLAWRMALKRSSLLSSWGVSNVQEVVHLVDQLWSSWSGAYHPPHLAQQSIHQAIAAPHVIRPRS